MRTISFKFSDGRAELGLLYLHVIDDFLILGGQVGVGLSTLSRAARSCWNSLGETKAAECEGTCIGAFAAGFPDVALVTERRSVENGLFSEAWSYPMQLLLQLTKLT